MADITQDDMTVREKAANDSLDAYITRTTRQEELEASLKEGFAEMPSPEAFSSSDSVSIKLKTCANRILSAGPWTVAILAYTWAQAAARGVNTLDELMVHLRTTCLSSPEAVTTLLRKGLSLVGGPLPPVPTMAGCLNICGGTVFLISTHNLMRTVLVKLVKTARRTATLIDDVAFGILLCMFPRAHVIFDSANLDLTLKATGRQRRSHVEYLPITLRFASVGDNLVR